MTTLTVTDRHIITEREDRDVIVTSGAKLTIAALLTGDLTVEAGARVDIDGGFGGQILVNDGAVFVVEGAIFGDQYMTPFGFQIIDRDIRVTVNRDTPRHRVIGTHGRYGVQI